VDARAGCSGHPWNVAARADVSESCPGGVGRIGEVGLKAIDRTDRVSERKELTGRRSRNEVTVPRVRVGEGVGIRETAEPNRINALRPTLSHTRHDVEDIGELRANLIEASDHFGPLTARQSPGEIGMHPWPVRKRCRVLRCIGSSKELMCPIDLRLDGQQGVEPVLQPYRELGDERLGRPHPSRLHARVRRGQDEGQQEPDDQDHDQQLDQREPAGRFRMFVVRSHGLVAPLAPEYSVVSEQ